LSYKPVFTKQVATRVPTLFETDKYFYYKELDTSAEEKKGGIR
jgi:hypothetical protein